MVGNILDADKVMFGSDYPHPASTWPHSQQILEEQLRGMASEIRQKLVRDNARALFGL
jgi:predicted TIM-barrel fold metal-dependent hydrolase